MQIIETDKGYDIKFDYNKALVEEMHTIPGAWFHRETRTWKVSKHRYKEIAWLRQRHGVKGNEIHRNTVPEQYGEIPPLPELTVDLKLVRKPFPFQNNGIAYLMEKRRVIIGDQPGLGKTQQAIGACMALGLKRILVICPSTLKLNWQKEWMDVAGRKAIIMNDSIKNTWHTYLNVGYVEIMVTNYESLRKYFVAPGWKKQPDAIFRLKDIPFRETIGMFEAVIIDESHKVKDGSTQQAKFVMGICRNKEYIFALTGTPVINKPKDLVSQLHILNQLTTVIEHIPQPKDNHGRLTDSAGYKRFLERYCDGQAGSNLKELNYRLNKYCFYRREKQEVLQDLPAKMRQIVLCEISNRQEYQKAEREFVDYLKTVRGCTDSEVARKLRGEMMVKIGILKQISARGKINDAQEHVQEIIDSGEKVVLFCHLKEIAHAIKDLFPGSVTITGDDSTEARDRHIRRFQTDPGTQLIICSLQAGGIGITLTASSRVVFVEFPWTYALCEQAEDRTHRIGQVNSVQCTYFLGDKTIDEYCYKLIQKKKSIAQAITGSTEEIQEEIIDELLNLFNQR